MPFLIKYWKIMDLMLLKIFHLSGSLFVEKEAPASIRASAQGLFMLMANGLGAIVGGYGSGLVVDYFSINGLRDWESIWFTFAIYALILAIIFPIVFKYRHDRKLNIIFEK
jgi:NHS family xanthosine MFS transporter